MNRLLLGLWWFLMIPFVVNGQQVSLQATGEGLSSEEAQQAALAELSFRIAANVESQIDSAQELRNEEFNQTASQRLSVTSELPILGKGKGNKIINIPKDKLASGEEFMAHAQLLSINSSLKIEVGKRFVTLKPQDWNTYILSRAKRGKKVGKLVNIERLTEELNISKDN